MIASVSGKVVAIGERHLIIEVGGIGLQIEVPTRVRDQAEIGRPIRLLTHLSVRDDGLALYGFPDDESKAVFEVLIGLSGIGPRSAMAILSALSPDLLRQAVIDERPDVLAGVPGIGRKTAAKIIFELKDKFGKAEMPELERLSALDADVIDALTALGYSIAEAQAAVQSLGPDAPESVEERVRLALQYFG